MENTRYTPLHHYDAGKTAPPKTNMGLLTLKRKLVGAFLLVALIMAFVGGIDWFGVTNLSNNIRTNSKQLSQNIRTFNF